MVQRLRANQRFVCSRQECEARPEAGAKDSDALVALAEPPDGSSRIENSLTTDLHGSRNVRADDVVGAAQLGWHALIVVGQREPQRTHAGPGEDPAEADVAPRVSIPLGQHEDR